MGWSDLVLVLSSWLTRICMIINSFVLIFSCGHDPKQELEYLISQITNAFTQARTKTKTKTTATCETNTSFSAFTIVTCKTVRF